jgi:RloB-like protein
MILKNRFFERRQPSRDAKSFYLFCEGNNREPQYLLYFKEIDSRINIEVIAAAPHDNNSPTGLYEKACSYLFASANHPIPKFELLEMDEVWFIIDTDKWGSKITQLRALCEQHPNWYIAQSNPCFEVWLYYHFEARLPNFEGMEVSKNWKNHVNRIVKGGFDARKHPVFLKTAMDNAQTHYSSDDAHLPVLYATEMFKLGERIYPFVKEAIEQALKQIR